MSHIDGFHLHFQMDSKIHNIDFSANESGKTIMEGRKYTLLGNSDSIRIVQEILQSPQQSLQDLSAKLEELSAKEISIHESDMKKVPSFANFYIAFYSRALCKSIVLYKLGLVNYLSLDKHL